jgi:hypothetical protein
MKRKTVRQKMIFKAETVKGRNGIREEKEKIRSIE